MTLLHWPTETFVHFSEKKIIYQAMFIAVIVLKAQNCNMSLDIWNDFIQRIIYQKWPQYECPFWFTIGFLGSQIKFIENLWIFMSLSTAFLFISHPALFQHRGRFMCNFYIDFYLVCVLFCFVVFLFYFQVHARNSFQFYRRCT